MRQCGCICRLIHKADVCNDDCAYPALNQVYTQCVIKTHTVGNYIYKTILVTEMDFLIFLESLKFITQP